MELEIRRFDPSDIRTVYDIQQAAYRPLWEKYHDDMSPYMESREKVLQKYTRAGTDGYVFIMDGEPAGAVRVNTDRENGKGRISALGVHPRFQGRGIAQKALTAIEEMYGDIRHWYLDTVLEEKSNCHLYEKLGYVKTGKTEKINEKMTLVFYEKHR
ncbi:MAG: GNAT family N-acetyltransferase [Clostridiales bacterium]|nr:GNAT family N-acetyltransferase [Clostridiales bacterium]